MLEGLHFAVLLEEGTNPVEYNCIRLRLMEEEARVTVIGTDRLEYALEDHSHACADVVVSEASNIKFDGVFIPGGIGPEKLRLNPGIIDLVLDCHARGKICAAICHGQFVLISAGLMRGIKAAAAWSMQDDLREIGAVVPPDQRAVRDRQFVTAMFPQDLPLFFQLALETISEVENRSLTAGYPGRLTGKRYGILSDNFTDAVQLFYIKLRIEEEGGSAVLIGRKAGQIIKLSSYPWEWGEFGLLCTINMSLPNGDMITSCDEETEINSHSVRVSDLDGLFLPGGLSAMMMRGHKGLAKLIADMHSNGKIICAVERGVKILFCKGMLDGKTITCAPCMKDDVIYSTSSVKYSDEPVVFSGNLLTCKGIESLPLFMRTFLKGGNS